MMRKLTVFVAAMLAVLLMISGCTHNQPDDSQPSDVHQAQSQWDRDANEHWRTGADGEKLDAAAHTLEEDVCTVCGSGIIDFGESVYVYNYNEYDDQIRNSAYENGVLVTDWITEYEYDGSGNYVTVKNYENGTLYQVDAYTMNADGENVICKSTNYSEGSYVTTEYDEHGNASADYCYDADGVQTEEIHYEYELDENGDYYIFRSTCADLQNNTTTVESFNVQGDVISNVYYLGEEQVEASYYEYRYDEEGRTIYKSTSDDEMLLEEVFYGVFEETDGWYTYMQKSVIYNEDGTKSVTEYDENEDPISKTDYDAEGNVID
jgi:hypothetical protein